MSNFLNAKDQKPEISVILPCRNEEEGIGICIESIEQVFEENVINGEIIVSDSSTDNSVGIAGKYNVKIVKHDKEGYGIAYLEGLKAAEGNHIFMADADGTYDFRQIPEFLKYLNQGFDFVIGNRFKGEIETGAMPWLHRHVGNPILSFLFRVFFKSKLRDIHCGMRAITKKGLDRLNLRTTGMEFASEMVTKAIKRKLKTKELPINYYVRRGESKLRSFADGWRHLRFMLLYSPLYLFLFPGIMLFILGQVSMAWLYWGDPTLFGIRFYYHPMFLSSVFMMLGYQMIFFSLFAKTYAITHLGEESPKFQLLFKYLTIEKASVAGVLLALTGLSIYVNIFVAWVQSDFSALQKVKTSIVALTLIALGAQTVFSSFMLSILGIREK